MNRKIIKKWDVVVLLGIVVLAAIVWFIINNSDKGSLVQVVVNGSERYEYSLNSHGLYDIDSSPTMKLKIDSSGASVIEAQCPDKLCEAAGVLSKQGHTAVCIPARVVVKIIGDESGVDIMTE